MATKTATAPKATPKNAGRNGKGQFTKGNPGKPKGTKNKITREIKSILEEVIDGEGVEGLRQLARDNPAAFWNLAGKLLPARTELTGADGGPINIQGAEVPPPASTLDEWMKQHGDDE